MLIWWAECCTLAETSHCEILFATLCSLSLSHSRTNSFQHLLLAPHHLHLEPSSLPSPPPPSRPYFSRVSVSRFSHPVFSLQLECLEPETKQAASRQGEAAGGVEMCPASSSDLLPAPTFSSLQSSAIYAACRRWLIRRRERACNIHGTPCREQRRRRSLSM